MFNGETHVSMLISHFACGCGCLHYFIFLSDSFTVMYYPTNGPEVQVPLYRKGIAWYTDKNIKFRNPPTNNTFKLPQAFEGTHHTPHAIMTCYVCFSHCCLSVCSQARLCPYTGSVRFMSWMTQTPTTMAS